VSKRAVSEVRDGWIELLGRYDWQWFVTLTFRGSSVHPEKADKKWRVWLDRLNTSLFGRRWWKKSSGVRWARALEYQRRGVIHFHALVGGVPGDKLGDRLPAAAMWQDIAGFSRVDAIKNLELVKRYVSKYVVKGGEIDVGGDGFPAALRRSGWPVRVREWRETALGAAALCAQVRSAVERDEWQGLLDWATGRRLDPPAGAIEKVQRVLEL